MERSHAPAATETPAVAAPEALIAAAGGVEVVLALQKTAGNRAVGRLLQREAMPRMAGQPLGRLEIIADVGAVSAQLVASAELVPPEARPGAFDGYATRFHAIARAATATTVVAIVRDAEGRFHAFDTGHVVPGRGAPETMRPRDVRVSPVASSGWSIVDWARLHERETGGDRARLAARASALALRYRRAAATVRSGEALLADTHLNAEQRSATEAALIRDRAQLTSSAPSCNRSMTASARISSASRRCSSRPRPAARGPGFRCRRARGGDRRDRPCRPDDVRARRPGEAGMSYRLPTGEHDATPAFGLAVSSELLESGDQAGAVGTLAHEATHYAHAQQAADLQRTWQRERAARRTTLEFRPWLRSRHLPPEELALVEEAIGGDQQGTQLLAYAEGFCASFHLRVPRPDPPADWFGQLDGVARHWAGRRSPVARALLARLRTYYVDGLDRAHQDLLDRWIDDGLARPPATGDDAGDAFAATTCSKRSAGCGSPLDAVAQRL